MKSITTAVRKNRVWLTWLLGGLIVLSGITSPEGSIPRAHAAGGPAPRLVEDLGRGLTAVYLGDNKVYLSWRLLGTEPQQVTFDIYRRTGSEEIKLNDHPLAEGTNYTDENVDVTQRHTYIVKSYVSGTLQGKLPKWSLQPILRFEITSVFHCKTQRPIHPIILCSMAGQVIWMVMENTNLW
ncbi:hypothetical protein N6H13_07725 [Paenibacillus sp. CC-CFT742]|nr:hypothetical protein [Paenibacillus sp. CC-CFT742]WJH31858.1 hypothetical protein N6H13_07725 [Paenibacillus sp. CC-CFT742]